MGKPKKREKNEKKPPQNASEENKKKTKMGWVYAFGTPSMPGIVKIGATRRDPAERLREANTCDTWRPPHPYVTVCVVEVEDPFAAERAIHALLAARRVTLRHEFFDLTAHDARVLLALIAPARGAAALSTAALVESAPPRAQHTAGSLVAHAHQEAASQTPEGKLRAWVESNYTRVDRKEKDTGTKLEELYAAYTAMAPPVHPRPLGRNHFAKMLESIYPGIGPHRRADTRGIYLLR